MPAYVPIDFFIINETLSPPIARLVRGLEPGSVEPTGKSPASH
jgi:hypothetical protein